MTDLLEATVLPDQQKLDLCMELLEEFGAGRITKRGYELQHRCTLGLGGHTDNNSVSASVNYHKLEFNCFVCGNGGSLAWWIAVNRRTENEVTSLWLSKKLGLGSSMPINDLLKVIESIWHPAKPDEQKMPVFNDKILERWTHWDMFHPYLTEDRKIPVETLQKFQCGYADEDTDFGYHHRVIIPCRWKGRLVGWQARTLLNEREKYKNSPGFPRDRILYGDVDARKVVVVESPMSVLRHSHQTPMVATFGSNLSESQIRALQQFEEVIFFNENDKAGLKMIYNGIGKLSRHVRVNIVPNPYTKEVDSADLDDDTFISLVNDAVPSALWSPKRYSELVKYN